VIAAGQALVGPKAAQIARTMGLKVTNNAALPAAETARGFPLVVHAGVKTAKMMALKATKSAVGARAQVEGRQGQRATGIAVAEHVEGSGKVLVQTQAVSFLGALQSACRITLRRDPSALPQVQLSSQLPLLEILFGTTVQAAENVSCLHLLQVER